MPIVPQFISKRINRSALKSLRTRGARIDRFKLTSRKQIRATLLAQTEVAAAVARHAIETGITDAAAWKKVETYIDEIVPFFNILAYSRFGYFLSRRFLNAFYKVSADQHSPVGASSLPKDAVVVYLMNHRSNADYVLVGYVLSG